MGLQLKSVDIKNFKKILNKSIKFTEGLNTIYGQNFAGKTTVVQAILFALYGPSSVEGSSSDLANTSEGGKAHVILNLSEGLSIERKGSSVTLSKNGKAVARSATVVTESIGEYLGLTKTQLLKTRVSQQGEAQILLATGSAELKKLVEGLSGYDRIERVLNKAKSLKKTNADKVSALEEVYIGDATLRSQEAELQDLLKGVKKLVSRSETVSNKLAEAEEAYKIAKLEKSEADQQNNEAKVSQALVQERSSVLSELLVRQKNFGCTYTEESIKELKQRYTELKSLIYKQQQRLKLLSKQSDEASMKDRMIGNLVSDLKNLNKEIRELDPPKTSEQDLRSLIEAVDKQTTQYSVSIEANLSLIDGSVCGTCNRPFDEHSEFDKDKLQSEVVGLQALLDKSSQESRKLKAELKSCVETTTTIDRVEREIKNTERKLRILREEVSQERPDLLELEKLQEDSNKSQVKFKEIEGQLQDATRQLAELEAIDSQVKKAEESLERAKSEQVSFIDTSALEADCQALKSDSDKLSSQLRDISTKVNVSQSKCAVLKESTQSQSKLKARIREVTKDLKLYDTMAKIITTNRGNLMDAVWSGIMQEATNFVSEVTEGYIDSVFVDDSFAVRYSEQGKEYPVSSASGSQKSLIGLGIRIGIGNLLPSNTGFFIMDEVTADMEETVSMLAMNSAKVKCSQIIAVSHRQSDMATSDNLISVLR